MSELTVSKEDAVLLVDSEYDNDGPVAGLTFVATQYEDSLRWTELWLLVVRDYSGKLWGTYFEKGGDEGPFPYADTVTFNPVVEKTVVAYELIR